MDDQVVHGTRDGTTRRPGESDRTALRGDEPPVDERLTVVLQGFSQAAQGPLDEAAVVRDPLAVEDGRVERPGVAQEDVLRPACGEEMGRPVRIRIPGRGLGGKRPGLDLAFSLWDGRKVNTVPPIR